MSRLTWTEQLDGWRSGPYRIELAAPGIWVLTRNTRRSVQGAPERIEATSGSLSCLKYDAEQLARNRARTGRLIRRSVVLALAVLAVAASSSWAVSWAPVASLVGTCVAIVSSLGVIDSFAERSFEHLKETYQ